MTDKFDIGSNKSFLSRFIAGLTNFGVIIMAPIMLILLNFFPHIFNEIPIINMLSTTTALLGLSIPFVIWYFLRRTKAATKNLEALSQKQIEFFNANNWISQMPLMEAFTTASKKTREVGLLRIYSITGQQMYAGICHSNIKVKECRLLVQNPPPNCQKNRDTIKVVEAQIALWEQMKETGNIEKLIVRYYDFFPTEYECIFDDNHLIFGLFTPVPSAVAKVDVRMPILIRGNTDTGKQLIDEFVTRFDKLFETCTPYPSSNMPHHFKFARNFFSRWRESR